MSVPEYAASLMPAVPTPAEVGFLIEEGAMVEMMPGIAESRVPLEEVLRQHLEDVGAVASDPAVRRAAVEQLREFAESEIPLPDDDSLIYNHFVAAREAAGYALSVIANFTNTPTLRTVLIRGTRDSVQKAIHEDGGLAADTFVHDDQPLAKAVHASLQLAVAMYVQTHEGNPYEPAG